jgi:hypothetical protein
MAGMRNLKWGQAIVTCQWDGHPSMTLAMHARTAG